MNPLLKKHTDKMSKEELQKLCDGLLAIVTFAGHVMQPVDLIGSMEENLEALLSQSRGNVEKTLAFLKDLAKEVQHKRQFYNPN